MTAVENKPLNPVAHLSTADVEAIGRELDDDPAVRPRRPRRPRRGVHPAGHRRAAQARAGRPRRCCSAAGTSPPGCSARPASRWPRCSTTWRSGTTSCTASGTGCATRRSTRPPGTGTTRRRRSSGSARTTCTHHTYTNILGKDNDLGYGIMRVDEDQPWKPRYLVQPLWNFVNACIFEYGIAMYDIDLGDHLRAEAGHDPRAALAHRADRRQGRPAGRQGLRALPGRCPDARGAAPWRPTSPPTSPATCGATR